MSDDYAYLEIQTDNGTTLIQESAYYDDLPKPEIKGYNPDVLQCLANLSNDEVFTPPSVANAMLDLLPEEIWSDPKVTFLDPCCKSGIFLREIAKRLIQGLEEKIPDLQQRLDHIFKKQLYALAITELTALLSRRSVYCSKQANGKYSLTTFDTPEGNILLPEAKHDWGDKGRCKQCGASQKVFGERSGETHAYAFIHAVNPEEIFKMKFDVIIGNPPYQLSDGGAQASATPIYQHFVNAAKRLSPRYISFIIPARWYTGGKGLDLFRKEMINDQRIQILHDFVDAAECFNGVEIKGGVCYFLWERETVGECLIFKHSNGMVEKSKRYLVEDGEAIFIREKQLITIKNKVWGKEQFSLETITSSRKPYGLSGDFFDCPLKYGLPDVHNKYSNGDLTIVGLTGLKRTLRYVPKDYPLPKKEMLDSYKIFVPRNVGSGELGDFTPQTVIAPPKMLCTETFVQIGPFKTEQEAINADKYLKTKFVRTLISIRKQDQGASKVVYHFVPMQDFSKPWTDEELYKKYGLTDEEIAFIESMVKPMGEK